MIFTLPALVTKNLAGIRGLFDYQKNLFPFLYLFLDYDEMPSRNTFLGFVCDYDFFGQRAAMHPILSVTLDR